MFAIEMLPAGHGDALVVEYGTREYPRQLLIDAGPYHSWPVVRERLKRRRRGRYEVFVVTHVDEDHIGGSIALLDDPDLRHRVSHVWFNGYVHCDSGGSVLGPVNGEQLTHRIVTGTFEWNEPFKPRETADVGGSVVVPSIGDLPVVPLGGDARAVLLSPSGSKLRRMADVWCETVTAAGLVPGTGDTDHNTAPSPYEKKVDELPETIDSATIKRLAGRTTRDSSRANGSSIAFVLEYGKKRLLLAGDAHADVLAMNLRRYGAMVGEVNPRIDLVKLAHHGSKANVSTDMLLAMKARRFLISSNGDNFGHPNDEAIACIVESSTGEVTFYCNYSSPRTAPWKARGASVGANFMLPQPGKEGLRVPV